MSEETKKETQLQLITLNLDLNEVNFILTMLGKEQYNLVSGLISKIREQGLAQISAQS